MQELDAEQLHLDVVLGTRKFIPDSEQHLGTHLSSEDESPVHLFYSRELKPYFSS